MALVVALLVVPLSLARKSNAAERHEHQLVAPRMLSVNLNGLAKTLNKQIANSYPFRPDGMMFLNGEPVRLRCMFDKDVLERDVLYGERQIIVYPVNEYRKLFKAAEQLNEFDKRLRLLKSALKTGKIDRSEIGVLPSVDACQLFRAQVRFLHFKTGRGVRFVTRYATDVSATTGRNIFYTFQGLTGDEKYWIAVFYPVRVRNLRETTNADESKRRLDQMRPDQYSPDLNKLDTMVKSISVQALSETSD